MGLSDELRAGTGSLWEKVVNHTFVIQLGDNTLPRANQPIQGPSEE